MRFLWVVVLVVVATGQWCWAGGVKPSAEPRFGVEGERHRMVLPLSAFPAVNPKVARKGDSVNVTLKGLAPAKDRSHRPKRGSKAALGIGQLDVRKDGVRLTARRGITDAKAFLLKQPPRLVVDLYLGASQTSSRLSEEVIRAAPKIVPVGGSENAQAKGAGDRSDTGSKPKPISSGKSEEGAGAYGSMVRNLTHLGDQKPESPAAVDRARASADSRPRPDEIGVRTTADRERGEPPEYEVGKRVTPPTVLRGSSHADGGASKVAKVSEEARTQGQGAAQEAKTGTEPSAEGEDAHDPAAEAEREARKVRASRERTPYRLEEFRGRSLIWPDLEAPYYARADTEVATARFVVPNVEAIRELANGEVGGSSRSGGPSVGEEHAEQGVDAFQDGLPADPQELAADVELLPAHAPAAAHYLVADRTFLRAVEGAGSFFDAVALYRRAVRLAPHFADEARGYMMIGFSELGLGFASDAAATFAVLARDAEDPAIVGLANLAAGRASRIARAGRRAALFLRRAIDADPDGEGGCYARAELAVIEAERRRADEGLVLLEEMTRHCPGYVIAAPRTLLNQVGVLAAAGRLREAEELVLALPEFHGDLFVRRKFLEADVAQALGNLDSARRAYERVRGEPGLEPAVVAEAGLRLARVEDLAGDTQRAGEIVSRIAAETQSTDIQAKALATAAELLAGRGHHAEALRLLERADVLGPAGFTIAELTRAKIFGSWISRLAKEDDDAGILAVFYGYRGDGIGSHLKPPAVVRVASAASALGLPGLAADIVETVQARTRGSARTEAQKILAQAALDEGESAEVLRLTGQQGRAARYQGSQRALARIRGEALMQLGRVDEAEKLLKSGGNREDLLALGTAYLREGADAQKAYDVLKSALAQGDDGDGDPKTLRGWLAMAEAAENLGNEKLAATALRTAIRLFPEEVTPGVRYRLAQLEAAGASPQTAAERLQEAAKHEKDPLFARAAAADAAYHRAVEALKENPGDKAE